MHHCWQQNPRLRPTFMDILASVEEKLRPSFRLLSFYHSPQCQAGRTSLPPADAEPSAPPSPKEASSNCSPPNGGLGP